MVQGYNVKRGQWGDVKVSNNNRGTVKILFKRIISSRSGRRNRMKIKRDEKVRF